MLFSSWAAWRAWVARKPSTVLACPKLLVVVEGKHDVDFLKCVSRTLHADDSRLPDLGDLEGRGRVVFVPFGGGDILGWAHRLAGLGQPECHLYDREQPPETEVRQRAAAIVNRRPKCRAFLTGKRALENYLSPQAIYEVRGVDIRFTDDDDVADLTAEHAWSLARRAPAWQLLPSRARKRLRDRAKRWLNTRAAERMTIERIDQCDPGGEIRFWLATMARLLR
jgi:hypothetical protein